ncbi:MAG TPA: DUF1289 domain-containing protein [Steroidobacteraceae bacterium]|nr:DUF1289 domain-containing protein [Steroidobacteraceae bacterium]
MDNPDSAPPSPCLRKCCLDDEGTCLGCFRSLEEIREWAGTDTQRRHTILSNALQRRENAAQRREAFKIAGERRAFIAPR